VTALFTSRACSAIVSVKPELSADGMMGQALPARDDRFGVESCTTIDSGLDQEGLAVDA
jgi:hypothetical protein